MHVRLLQKQPHATPREGLEPSTYGLTVRRSNQLSYQGLKPHPFYHIFSQSQYHGDRKRDSPQNYKSFDTANIANLRVTQQVYSSRQPHHQAASVPASHLFDNEAFWDWAIGDKCEA